MDQGLDKNKPPSTSYRETFRRHRKLLCLPIILGALAAAFVLFGTGKTYKSTANVWVDTNPPAPSSLGASSQAEPPAAAEQTVLSELLPTRAFAAAVAKTLSRGKSRSSADAIRENVRTMLANGQVVGTVTGGQVLQISSSASSPAVAESVLGAVVGQLRNYTDRLAAQHDQGTVTEEKAQVKAAETALAAARSNVTAYQARHPGVSQTDPTYVSLVAAENNATTQLAQANTALSQMTGTGNADGWSITVIDPPGRASTATMRKSKMAEVILGGALAGLLVSFLAVVALTPAKKEVWEDELPIGEPLVPGVPPDPFRAGSPGVPTAPAQSTPAPIAAGQPRLSLGNRRFQFRTPSAPTEQE